MFLRSRPWKTDILRPPDKIETGSRFIRKKSGENQGGEGACACFSEFLSHVLSFKGDLHRHVLIQSFKERLSAQHAFGAIP